MAITDILARPEAAPRHSNTSEDPIEALDALQDAIDRVEESLPASPIPGVVPRLSAAHAGVLRQSILRASTSAGSPRLAQIKQKSAIAALHTPPKPAKSNKAVTKSSFQLPGEAIAAKLKAQREERKEREEDEEEKKRKSATARSGLKSTRTAELGGAGTMNSRPRMSIVRGTLELGRKPESRTASTMITARPSMAPRGASSTAKLASRTVAPTSRTPTDRTKPATATTNSLRKPTVSATVRSTPDSTAVTKPTRSSLGKQRESIGHANSTTVKRPAVTRVHSSGVDVYRRPLLQKAAEEKALKEKIEAHKKARAEAAERSRQLSREFAEKKKGASKPTSRNVSGTETGAGSEVAIGAAAEVV